MTIRRYVKLAAKSSPIRSVWYEDEYYDKNEGLNTLAQMVYEPEYELIDTGLLDHDGNKIMIEERPSPIGFFHFGD